MVEGPTGYCPVVLVGLCGDVEGRLLLRLRIHIHTLLIDQVLHCLNTLPEACSMQRAISALILEAGSLLGEILYDAEVAVARREHDGCPADVALRIQEPLDIWFDWLLGHDPLHAVLLVRPYLDHVPLVTRLFVGFDYFDDLVVVTSFACVEKEAWERGRERRVRR